MIHSARMNRFPTLLLALLGWVCVSISALFAASQDNPWTVTAGKVQTSLKTGVTLATGGAVVSYEEKDGEPVELSAETMSINRDTGEVVAKGTVFLRGRGQTWIGDELRYNFKTEDIGTASFRTGLAPIYAAGSGLGASVSNNVYSATNAVITTDDLDVPYYRVEAKEVTIVPGKEIRAKKATVYIGKTPIFYLPNYRRSLERHPNNWVVNPGYRSLWGPYLLMDYNWIASSNLSGAMHLDLRQRRGIGVGPQVAWDLGRYGEVELDSYYIHDENPQLSSPVAPPDADRHRVKFVYQAEIRTNFNAKVVVRHQGDPFILRDFFEWEYRRNTQPSSFAEVEYLWDNYSLNVLAMPRVNDFFERIERLPEIRFTGLRKKLGETPWFLESETSAGYLKHEFANNATAPFAATRVDTYHQAIMPKTFNNWLTVTPRVGGRYTYYSETEGALVLNDAQRWVFNTGAEVSTKLTRTWNNTDLKLFKSRGIRHIMRPTVNYVYVPSPNKRPIDLPQFDTTIPTFRLLPLDYPDFNSIDAVDSENTLRFGLRNNVQTKRDGQVDTLFNWNLFTDWRLRRRPNQDTFADLFSDLDFRPREWAGFTSSTRYDLDAGVFSLADHRVVLSPYRDWNLSLGHRYVRRGPLLGVGHNLFLANYYYRLNENYGFNMRHTFEGRDGVMEEQSYSVYRDFRSWVGSLTFRLRDNRAGADDFTVGFTFSSKAFPRFDLGSDRDTPEYLIGNR